MCYHNGRKTLSKEAAVKRIPVLVEPDYRNSLWARQTLEGIAREAARKKYEPVLLDAAQEEQIDWDGLFDRERRLVMLMGTSMSWVPAAQYPSKTAQYIHTAARCAATALQTAEQYTLKVAPSRTFKT